MRLRGIQLRFLTIFAFARFMQRWGSRLSGKSWLPVAISSLAAKTRGVPAYIAMPRVVSRVKVAANPLYAEDILWADSGGGAARSEECDVAAARIHSEMTACL